MMLSAIGAGVRVAGGISGAVNGRHTARMNHIIDMGNARVERENTLASIAISEIQDRLMLSSATTAFELATRDNEMRTRNADRLRAFAETRTKEGRQGIRRTLRDFEEFTGRARAGVGASGVSFEGSVLDVLTNSAGEMQKTIQDLTNEISAERDNSINSALIEEWSSVSSLISSRTEYDGALSAGRVGEMSRTLAVINADLTFASRKFGATVARNEASVQARGQMIGAAGAVFAGGANFARQRYEYNQFKPQSSPYSQSSPYASGSPVTSRPIRFQK